MELETAYRKRIEDLFRLIESAFSDVDPDIAECEQSMGALTITLSNGKKCILSAQPSVRQLWLALAAKGRAYHFNFDEKQQRWMDDKNTGTELLSCIQSYLKETAGLSLKI